MMVAVDAKPAPFRSRHAWTSTPECGLLQSSIRCGGAPAFLRWLSGPGPVKIFDNLTALLNERPDIVAIASPTEFHAEHIAVRFDASIPRLWIEKPATLQLGELKSLLLHMGQLTHWPRTCVNYSRRCLPQIDYMKAHLAAADPDRPVRMNVPTAGAWRMAHMLDLVGVLLGAQEAPELEFCVCPH